MSKENKEKIRVYEYAKSLNMSSKEILTILKRLNMPVNNHMSVMEPEMIAGVEQFFRDIKASAAAKRAADNGAAAEAGKGEQQKAAASAGANGQTKSKPQGQSQQRQAGSGSGKPQAAGKPDKRTQAGKADGQGKTAKAQSRSSHGQQGQGRDQANRSGQMNSRGAQGQAKTAGKSGGQRKDALRNDPVPAQAADNRRDSGIAVDDLDEVVVSKSKKTKPNHKRFDDSKASSLRGAAGKAGKGGKGKHQQQAAKKEKPDNTPKKIIVRGTMTVGELAKLLHKDVAEVIKKLLFLGVMATINQELDLDTIQLIAGEFGVEVELKLPVDEENFELYEEKDDPADLKERPPVVTIMGHVDHGKTTLLDAIRSSNVTGGEAGGITQHIGAYQVEVNGKKITFLDTPGHEAFTSMRARGAQVTDITILVVAADDGVMPQTVEAINHAKAANVPIIVAVNKVDKPEANPERIKQDLTEYGLVPEEWGGDTIFVNVSAKEKQNLDQLLEMVLLVAEIQELKANPDKRARGTVIEAELDKGKGPVARVLIQHGTLKVGDSFVAGVCFGRVRTMVNDRGKRLKEAGPSTPVEITGLTEVPQAGDPFLVFEDERKARDIAERRAATQRQTELGAGQRVTLDDLYKHIQEGEIKDLNVIIKADVQGSVEALRSSLEKIDVEGVRVKIIHAGVGAITESDIILASASNAIVIGFNVRPEPMAKAMAEQEKVDIRLHRIIYDAIEEIEAAMKGMLDPEYKETVIGQAEVRDTFKISRIGTVAGCFVTSGKIARNAEARVIRDGIVIYEGKIASLKRFKDDAREVAQGYECGIMIERFNDIKEGDVIEAFVMETVER